MAEHEQQLKHPRLTTKASRECSNKNQPVFKKGQSTKGIDNELNDIKHLQLRPQTLR